MAVKGKVVLITGASSGLGKEVATLLAKEGSKLALIARNEDVLNRIKKDLVEFTDDVEIYPCDITRETEIDGALEEIIKHFGKIDILINNAGQWFEGGLEDHSDKIIKDLFMVNSIGPILMTKKVLPYMKKAKTGTIFNVVSIAGVSAPGKENGEYTVYTATKFAEHGFTLSLREELKGSGIKVLGFYPAGMNTEIFKRAGFNYSDNEDWMMDKKDVAKIMFNILSQPDDIAIDHVEIHKFNK